MLDLLCWATPLCFSSIIGLVTILAAIYYMIEKSEKNNNDKKKEVKRKYSLEDQKEIK